MPSTVADLHRVITCVDDDGGELPHGGGKPVAPQRLHLYEYWPEGTLRTGDEYGRIHTAVAPRTVRLLDQSAGCLE